MVPLGYVLAPVEDFRGHRTGWAKLRWYCIAGKLAGCGTEIGDRETSQTGRHGTGRTETAA
jgi:hypothetical protein